MNDILNSPLSPTRHKLGPEIRESVITATLHDDKFNEFDVEIRYRYFDDRGRYLSDYSYTITWPQGFVPDMRPECLNDDVRHFINIREEGKIIMSECKDDITDDLS